MDDPRCIFSTTLEHPNMRLRMQLEGMDVTGPTRGFFGTDGGMLFEKLGVKSPLGSAASRMPISRTSGSSCVTWPKWSVICPVFSDVLSVEGIFLHPNRF